MTDSPRDAAPPPVPAPPRARNPRTRAQLRRDVIWQMAVPLGLTVTAVLVLMVLLIAPVGAPVRSVWADISLIFLIIPTAFFGLVVLALLVAVIVLVVYGLRELPYLFKRAQDFAALVNYRVEAGAKKAASVFLSIRSFTAGVRRAAKDVRGIFGSGG